MSSLRRVPGRDPGADKTSNSYEFGPFILDPVQHLLTKEGEPVSLTPKTYDTLLFLVQNSARMISKEELMSALWPDSFVEESNLTQQISMVRKALGETAGESRYVVTVPARGYRFAVPVKFAPPQPKDRPALELVTSIPSQAKPEEEIESEVSEVTQGRVSDRYLQSSARRCGGACPSRYCSFSWPCLLLAAMACTENLRVALSEPEINREVWPSFRSEI